MAEKEYIDRKLAIEIACEAAYALEDDISRRMSITYALESAQAADVVEIPSKGIGYLSDGYHTFNDLYYQRMVLFATIVMLNRNLAWKSRRHEDGELCFGGGWFIVGVSTPLGEYTYHYKEEFFDMFDCQELPVGKHWDGHTEKDVARLLSLPHKEYTNG